MRRRDPPTSADRAGDSILTIHRAESLVYRAETGLVERVIDGRVVARGPGVLGPDGQLIGWCLEPVSEDGR